MATRPTGGTNLGAVDPSTAYDGNGLRVEKTPPAGSATVYIFSGSKVIAEYVAGTAACSPSTEYIYSGAQLVATIAGGTTTYQHPDHLSTRVSTDTAGNITRTFGHYPFGEVWYETGTASKWKFTSYERDVESDNDYAMAHLYRPRLGRFLPPDPLAGSLTDPQSLNRYAYTRNDPVNNTDPSGMKNVPGYRGFGGGGGGGLNIGALLNLSLGLVAANGGFGGGSCTLDGLDTPCGVVLQVIQAGATYSSITGTDGNGSFQVWTPGGCVSASDSSGQGISGCVNGSWSTLWIGGNSSWAWTFTKTFVSDFFSPKFYKQELAEGGCLNTFLEGVDQADVLGPVLNGSPGFAETAIKGQAATLAARYAANQGLTVPLRSSVVRGILEKGETGAGAFAIGYFDVQALFGVYQEGSAALSGACH